MYMIQHSPNSLQLACEMSNEKGKILQTFDKWGKTYKIEFDITVDEAPIGEKRANVFHFTNGGNCCLPGQRIPALFIHKSGRFLVCNSELNKNGNLCKKYPIKYGHKYHFIISQDSNGFFKIEIDGNLKYKAKNLKSQDYENVEAYVSDPWHLPFAGCLENFQVSKGNNTSWQFIHCTVG